MKKNNNNSKLKQCTLYVDGMHCASCEVLIEKKLLKQNGIESVDASLKGNKVEINYVGVDKPDTAKLNKEFAQLGYTFSYIKSTQKVSPAVQLVQGRIMINPEKVASYFKIMVIIISLFIAFIIFDRLQLGKNISVNSSSSLPAFLILGLVAGLSSCAALVGGLLLSMIKQWNEVYIDSESQLEKTQPHLLFHVGRILSFTFFGGILGLLGQTVSLNNSTFFAILTILVSVVMLILALQMLGIEWAQKFKLTAPRVLTRYVADENNFQGKYMPFTLGVVTFLLPCGFTLIAQTVALASGSFIQGSLIMLFFALGTLPMLLGISFSGLKFNSKPHLTARFNLVAGIVIVFFALYNINGQLNVLGYPSLSDLTLNKDSNTQQVLDTNANGEQILKITAQGFAYIPTTSTTIKAGIPTVLLVDNKGIEGCGAFMAARGLFDNYVQLKPGENKVTFVPKKGTYKLTCSMGMVPPVTITVI